MFRSFVCVGPGGSQDAATEAREVTTRVRLSLQARDQAMLSTTMHRIVVDEFRSGSADFQAETAALTAAAIVRRAILIHNNKKPFDLKPFLWFL